MSFEEDLAAAQKSQRRHADVRVELNGKNYVIRVYAMDGTEYAAETLRHPPREDVPADLQYGYNLNSVANAVLPRCGKRVNGDEELDISDDEWASLLAVIDGGAAQEIVNVVYVLNEYASSKAAIRARKALSGSLPTSS